MKAKTFLFPLFLFLFVLTVLTVTVKADIIVKSYSHGKTGISDRNPMCLTYYNGTGYDYVIADAYQVGSTAVITLYDRKGNVFDNKTVTIHANPIVFAWYDYPVNPQLNRTIAFLFCMYWRLDTIRVYTPIYRYNFTSKTLTLIGTPEVYFGSSATRYDANPIKAKVSDHVYYGGKIWFMWNMQPLRTESYHSVIGFLGVDVNSYSFAFVIQTRSAAQGFVYPQMLFASVETNPQNPDWLMAHFIDSSTLYLARYTISSNTLTISSLATINIQNRNFNDGLITRRITYTTNNLNIETYLYPCRAKGIGYSQKEYWYSFKLQYANTNSFSGTIDLSVLYDKTTNSYKSYSYSRIYVLEKTCYPADNRPAGWGGTTYVWFEPYNNYLFVVTGAGGSYNTQKWNTGSVPLSVECYALGDSYIVKVADRTYIYFVIDEIPAPPPPELPLTPPPPSVPPDQSNFPTVFTPYFIQAIAIPLLILGLPAAMMSFGLGQIGAFLGLIIGVIISVLAGLLPTWTILIIGLALAYLLLKGKIGGGGGGGGQVE